MALRIGVDAGGTFTDVCLFDDIAGQVDFWKAVSTPDDPSHGIDEAIAHVGPADFDATARLPVRNVLSEPFAGVAGAQEMARLAGFDTVISVDMGGTRTGVALLEGGASEPVEHAAPTDAPPGDIHAVGTGGGSIAVVESGGRLAVGPRSAGADPGPVCIGRGGTEPTLTDANLVLQTLNPDSLLGGRLRLRPDMARTAIGALAETLRVDELSAAQAILTTVTTSIADEIRLITAQRGTDLQASTLVAFGGAGPLHAARLARDLGVARILVPRHAGMLGALGLLLTDPRAGFSAALPMQLNTDALPAIAEAFGLLRHRAAMWFAEQAIPAGARGLTRFVDLRSAGRTEEFPVALPDGPVTAATLDALAQAFAAAQERIQGTGARGQTVEIVTVRIAAAGRLARPCFQPRPDAGPGAAAARAGSRAVWMPEAGGWASCPVYDRDRLESGNHIWGPAIVEQMDTTTVILPGMKARVDPYLNLILRDE